MDQNRMNGAYGLLVASLVMSAGCASGGAERTHIPQADDARTEQCGVCGRMRFVQQVVQETGPSARQPDGGVLGGATGGVLGAPGVAASPRRVLDRLTIDMDFGGTQVVELPAPRGVCRGDRVEVRGTFVTLIRDDF